MDTSKARAVFIYICIINTLMTITTTHAAVHCLRCTNASECEKPRNISLLKCTGDGYTGKCATITDNGKVIERKCLTKDESYCPLPSCDSCYGLYCNRQNLPTQYCFLCFGENCTLESKFQGGQPCSAFYDQCLSIMFPENSSNAHKNVKRCFHGEDDPRYDLCTNAAEMGGFCRLCKGQFCNLKENDYTKGDPLPEKLNRQSDHQPDHQSDHQPDDQSDHQSNYQSDYHQPHHRSKNHNLSSRVFASTMLFIICSFLLCI